MKLLIKKARITDPASPHNGSVTDLLIENGIISKIAKEIKGEDDCDIFKAGNLYVSPGWLDMNTSLRDPGFEIKEDLTTGAQAAAQGGFTAVACMPATEPPIQSKAEVEYIKNKSAMLPVDIYPIGAISHGREGKDISEMYDMHLSGAVAFSDGKRPVSDAGLLNKALLYAKIFNGLVISFPYDKSMGQDGKVNESKISTLLGIKGIPALAEELMVARDIYLAEYTGSKLHFSLVSTARSVELIRQAKAKGLKITAEVSAHHLLLDETYLSDFDSNYKVMPPLRSKADALALAEGLADGTIDVICSDHSPENEEEKKREFDYAAYGIIGLETAFGALNSALKGKLSIETIIEKISINPRNILGLQPVSIKEGAYANLTLFDPDMEWTFSEKHIRSKSKNSPFAGKTFIGKALAVYNKGTLLPAI